MTSCASDCDDSDTGKTTTLATAEMQTPQKAADGDLFDSGVASMGNSGAKMMSTGVDSKLLLDKLNRVRNKSRFEDTEDDSD